MNANQVVTISFFKFDKFSSKWWAFTKMGIPPFNVTKINGLQFLKQLGSGAENGFSIKPNFGVYGILATWDDEAAANTFLEKNNSFLNYQKRAVESWTVFMKTSKVHGVWSGVTPFYENVQYNENELVGVITRATIHTKHLFEFWKEVPTVSQSIDNRDGLLFSIGIGEWPVFMQATFSLWENSKYMMDYAYKSQYHREVVKKTRQRGWYREEMFARFRPYRSVGEWEGVDILNLTE